MSWNVVLIGTLKTGPATTIQAYLSTHAFVTLPTDTPANTYFPALIRSSVTLKKSVSAQSSGGRDASLAIGRVEIDDTEGDLYQWPTYSIEMQPWALYVIALGRPYSERVLIARFRGRKSPEVVSAGVLGLNFGDRMTLLEKNIGSVYPNTISNTQLRGRPRPLVLGKAWQVPCEQPEITGNDRFEVTDSADFGGVDEVRDNGVLRAPGTQWKPSTDADIHGYELLTARGGKQAATVTGALTITGTDALGGIGAFASLTGWLFGTSTSVQLQRWSATDKSTFLSLSNADLDVMHNDVSGVGRCVRLEYPITTGKLYWEIQERTAGTRFVMGLCNKAAPIETLNLLTTTSYCFAWDPANGLVAFAGYTFGAPALAPTGPYRMAYDADAKRVWIGDSTGWLNGDPATPDGGYDVAINGQLAPSCMLFSSGQEFRLQPNRAIFAYTLPAGFDPLEGAAVAGVVALSGGGCRIASNGDSNAQLFASAITMGVAYTLIVTVLSAVSGAVEFLVGSDIVMTVTAPGTYARAFVASSGSLEINRAPGLVTDLIIDNVVVLPADSTQFLPGLIDFCAARAGLTGGDLDTVAIDALHTAAPYAVGMAVDGGTKIRDVLTLTLDAWLGWSYFNWADVLTVGRLTRPVIGESVMAFDALTLYGPIISRVDEARGMSNTLLARRNWEVFSDSEVPPAITGAERALVTAQYRITAAATPTSDPGFIIGQEPVDRERVPRPGMPSVLIEQAAADAEITRRVTSVFGAPTAFHEFKVLLDPSDLAPCFLELGEQVEVSNAYQSSYEAPVACILLAHEIEFPVGIVSMIGHGAEAEPQPS